MSASALFSVVALYFMLLLAGAWRTSRSADSQGFFIGNRRSHWALVAFGMVGTSLSGVTFISVPGAVGLTQFTYLQIVLGHVLGYLVVPRDRTQRAPTRRKRDGDIEMSFVEAG